MCPFLEKEDARCDSRLSLRQLDETFDYCVCNPEACAVYRLLHAERAAVRPVKAAAVQVA